MAAEIIYDESKVPDYSLPSCLVDQSGIPVNKPADWITKRRQEIVNRFEEHVYGVTPDLRIPMTVLNVRESHEALDGAATRVQADLNFGPGITAKVLLYVPHHVSAPAPVFLGLNFFGNHSIHPDPDIDLSKSWMRENDAYGIVDHHATESSRGISAGRWAIDAIVRRGYSVATVYCGDFDPDFHDGFKNGVHALFSRKNGDAHEWGTIGAWAWGLSRTLDYLLTRKDIDGSGVIAFGHSRLGKAALWAAAQDERFAAVISNCSGCGGAALSRRRFGETVDAITNTFPHWFCGEFSKYAGKEDELPIDQHMLLALIAPRPLYVASAEEDLWADPKGEFLSLLEASEVYRLLGFEGLFVDHMPEVGDPVSGRLSYHVRPGVHDVTPYDWERYLAFAEGYVR